MILLMETTFMAILVGVAFGAAIVLGLAYFGQVLINAMYRSNVELKLAEMRQCRGHEHGQCDHANEEQD